MTKEIVTALQEVLEELKYHQSQNEKYMQAAPPQAEPMLVGQATAYGHAADLVQELLNQIKAR